MNKMIAFGLFCLASALSAQVPVIDYSFQAATPAVVTSVLVQPDGKILVGGFFQSYAGSGKNNLVRLNTDGTVDPSFNTVGTGPSNSVQDMILMPDGRILIAGNFVEYDGIQTYFIARLMPDGTLDLSFNIPPNTINGAVLAIELHDQHKVLAGGEFFSCFGHSQPHIARFNYNGSLDTTFQVGAGFDHNVHELLVLPDLRILAGGQFYTYQGNPSGRLALLQPNGLFDGSMNNNPGFGGMGAWGVTSIKRQTDGKILAGGGFSMHNGDVCNGIGRLNMDGTVDPTFTSPFYPYAFVDAIAVQSDGKIYAGGSFVSTMYVPNVPGPDRFLRVNADGSRDDSFDVGTGAGFGDPSAVVKDIALQTDGKILVVGQFGTFDTETLYHQIIRLHASSTNGISDLEGSSAQAWIDPLTHELHITGFADGDAMLQVHGVLGQLFVNERVRVANGVVRMPIDADAGAYFISLAQGDKRVAVKVVVAE